MESIAPVQELCLGGCGFFGALETEGRCSVCFKDFVMKKQLLSAPSDSSSSPMNGNCAEVSKDKPKKRNRCFECRKKVGLTGFDCRCGGVFCGLHRYSDMHNCKFDYKKMAAEEIRKMNPLVIGAKIQKI